MLLIVNLFMKCLCVIISLSVTKPKTHRQTDECDGLKLAMTLVLCFATGGRWVASSCCFLTDNNPPEVALTSVLILFQWVLDKLEDARETIPKY